MNDHLHTTVTHRNKAVIVLGMHRSGTSALAGLLHELGLEMGTSLMSGREDENEKGFWEHEKIVSIHDRLLAQLGSSWSDTGPLPPDWFRCDLARQCQDEICQVLEADFGTESLWALKDPRMCRLMPLWKPVFERVNIEPLFILIVRNPLEVAASLQRRDNMDRSHALLLWLQYNLAAVKSTAGYQRRFLTFAQLLEQGAPRLEEILRGFLQQPAGLSFAAAGASKFLSSELRHHVMSDRSLEDVPDIINRLYRLLVNAAASGNEVEDAEWQAIQGLYLESTRLLNPWLDLSDALRRDLTSRNIAFDDLQRENEQLTRGLRHAEALVQEREAHVQVLDKALQEAQALVQERNERVDELTVALQEATRYVRQHETSISTLTAELEQLKQ